VAPIVRIIADRDPIAPVTKRQPSGVEIAHQQRAPAHAKRSQDAPLNDGFEGLAVGFGDRVREHVEAAVTVAPI
jgi:hypothetical protein